ncbi:MAG: sigma-54 dependent transcriptional regulator [Deltaproteobacteria bacterium]|nr:sigma-54 dependent transcriptional regulator [Deltaproteobacteria bacterium]
MSKPKIIIVDDEKSMRDFLSILFSKDGYEVSAFANAAEAIKQFETSGADLVITDLKMPGSISGLDLLKRLKEIEPAVTVIMLTAYASVDTAIEAMKAGAYDYFTKPFNVEEIRIQVKRALERMAMEKENFVLKKGFKAKHGFAGMVGESPQMGEVYQAVMSVASTKASVLISGESGTGKELVARAVHDEGARKDKPFVCINCGAIPETLLESELFGYVKGAFTGASANKQGLVELAEGGTLFLDEITEMPLNLQVKLLRFIQERNIRRIGGTSDIQVDIRIIAATNRDIEAEVKAGRFREDLYYRLNVIRIDVPPLRERASDIPALVRYFLEKYCREHSKNISSVSGRAMELLMDYGFPGNVRELENAIERGVTLEAGAVLDAESLPPSIRRAASATAPRGEGNAALSGFAATLSEEMKPDIAPGGIDLDKVVADFEKTIIEKALDAAKGGKKKAAELLGISFRSMRYKLAKYGKDDE